MGQTLAEKEPKQAQSVDQRPKRRMGRNWSGRGHGAGHGAGASAPPGKTWLDELYSFTVTKLPDFKPWAEVPGDPVLGQDMDGNAVTFAGVANAVQAFRAAPSIDTWRQLKETVINTLEIDAARMDGIAPGRGALFVQLEQLQKLAEQTEQTVESLSVDQPIADYEDLPRHIRDAKDMVFTALARLRDPESKYYQAYFIPQVEWGRSEPAGGNGAVNQIPVDKTILPITDKFVENKPGKVLQNIAQKGESFYSRRRILLDLRKKEETFNPADWFDLQNWRKDRAEKRDEAREAERQSIAARLTQEKPQIKLTENTAVENKDFLAQEKEAGKQAQPLVLYRFGQVLKGLDWLAQRPYLKVMYQPQDIRIYGTTMRKKGKHTSLDILGGFLQNWRRPVRNTRAGLLIHELSHSFAKTNDFDYGEGIKRLKVKQAVKNAETYEYAAENAFQIPEPYPVSEPPGGLLQNRSPRFKNFRHNP